MNNGLRLRSVKLNQFRILREIGRSAVTQELLGKRVGLSVAMINNYIKALQAQKFIACKRKNSKLMSYHLTIVGEGFLKQAGQGIVRECKKLIKEIEKPLEVSADSAFAADSVSPVSSDDSSFIGDLSMG